MSSFILEIAAYSIESALAAESAGAHRIELCDNPMEGGTTPSYGVLRVAKERLSIPVFPIIRPRGGHFVYQPEEVSIMKEDILLCKHLGFDGVVIGLLTADGRVDYETTAFLTELAWPMEVTFHRAFDRVKDPFEAANTIIRAGCQRILTSGQKPSAFYGLDLITRLVDYAGSSIIIMPGGGIRASNIAPIAKASGAREFHSAASLKMDEPFFCPESMEEQLNQLIVNELEIKEMLIQLSAI
jgi:copper homeostasis protein